MPIANQLRSRISQFISSRFDGIPETGSMVDDLIYPVNDRKYLDHSVSAKVRDYPAMLGGQERVLPSFLAKSVAGRDGEIVELGCYLGGSTVAMLDGLAQAGALNERGILIHSYDLFVANEYMLDHTLGSFGVKAGESFQHVFRQLLGDWAKHVKTHAGDIRKKNWKLGPIKLLYVDILWSWETNQHVFDKFYRALEPGSWLIHQDYVYSAYPWLPVTMEWLIENGYFSIHHFAEHSTVAFQCLRSPREIKAGFRPETALSTDKKVALLSRSARRFGGYPAALLLLSQAILLIQCGEPEKAAKLIRHVKSTYTHEYAKYHVGVVEGHLPEGLRSE